MLPKADCIPAAAWFNPRLQIVDENQQRVLFIFQKAKKANLKQNGTQENKLLSGIILHSPPCGTIGFVESFSLKNHLNRRF